MRRVVMVFNGRVGLLVFRFFVRAVGDAHRLDELDDRVWIDGLRRLQAGVFGRRGDNHLMVFLVSDQGAIPSQGGAGGVGVVFDFHGWWSGKTAVSWPKLRSTHA